MFPTMPCILSATGLAIACLSAGLGLLACGLALTALRRVDVSRRNVSKSFGRTYGMIKMSAEATDRVIDRVERLERGKVIFVDHRNLCN